MGINKCYIPKTILLGALECPKSLSVLNYHVTRMAHVSRLGQYNAFVEIVQQAPLTTISSGPLPVPFALCMIFCIFFTSRFLKKLIQIKLYLIKLILIKLGLICATHQL